MPSFTMTVPYARASPLYIPRRDLVLAVADSLSLRVTIVERDEPDALPIVLTGGVGGPAAQLLFWADSPACYRWDYQMATPAAGYVLFNGTGALSSAAGSFDFSFPSGTMANWPLRCGWGVQLNYNIAGTEVLMTGFANIRRLGLPFTQPAMPFLETDDYIPIHTDIEEQVLA